MNKKILILDDDASFLETLSIVLTDNGYDIVALSNSKNIFSTIDEFHPELILMDIMLGDVDGRAICSKLKQQNSTKDIHVILLTGIAALANPHRQWCEPDDVLSKPFELDVLLTRIENQFVN